MRLIVSAITLCALTLVGCGEGPDELSGPATSPDEPTLPDTQEPPVESDPGDAEAPYVVSVTPANGAIGVRADASVIFEFSEPMDRYSVEHNLLSDDLGLTFADWNEAGDALTLTPKEPLSYVTGEGVAPGALSANRYHVVLGTGATDLAGSGIVSGAETVFETLKELTTTLERDNMLTGTATAARQVSDSDDFLDVGDDDNDEGHRSFVSFDLAMLPWGSVEVVEATLTATQISEAIGQPYVELGTAVIIDQVIFDALDNGAFNTDPLSEVGDFAVSGDVELAIDVTPEVHDDLVNRLDRADLSQFRLRFETINNEDGGADQVLIGREDLLLSVTYLVP